MTSIGNQSYNIDKRQSYMVKIYKVAKTGTLPSDEKNQQFFGLLAQPDILCVIGGLSLRDHGECGRQSA